MELIERCYRHPTQPGLGVEVLTYRSLTRRLTGAEFARPHRLDFHQLTLVNDGSATAMVDFVEWPCGPGTLLHTRPGQVHRLPTSPDGRRPAELDAVIVLFTPAFTPHSVHTAMVVDEPFGPTTWQLGPADHTALSRAIEDLAAESRMPDAGSNTLTVALLRHLLAAVLLRVARLGGPLDGAPATDDCFHRFWHEVEQSFAVVRRAQTYAERLGYSLKTLNRTCHQATGHTAKEIIDSRVVLEAKRLLAHTDLPVAVIGSRLGFAEPTNFGKFFAHRAGATPAAFRHAHQVGP